MLYILMEQNWSIEFVNKEAQKEFDALSISFKAKFVHITNLIEQFGPWNVGMPHIRFLGDKLWEIRMKAQEGVARSIYVVEVEKKIIILHTFIKKTQKTPSHALEKAKNRIKEINNVN